MSGFQSKLPHVWRTRDTGRINEILNHPEVRPWVADAGEGRIDLSSQVERDDVAIVLGEHGGFVVWHYGGGIWEVHTQVLPEGRGAWTRDFIQAGIRWLFTKTNAVEVLTRVPDQHSAARVAAIQAGMRYEFTPDRLYRFRGEEAPVHVYSMRLLDWAAKAPEMEETGRWLHSRFAEEGERLGLHTGEGEARAAGVRWGPLHEDMPSHNRYVGLAYHSAMGKNAARGVLLYNRWAMASHRSPHMLARLVSEDPPTLWFDHTTIQLQPDGDIRMAVSVKKE